MNRTIRLLHPLILTLIALLSSLPCHVRADDIITPPDLSVDPGEFDIELPLDATLHLPLTVHNDGDDPVEFGFLGGGGQEGFLGRYYHSGNPGQHHPQFGQFIMERVDRVIDFDWGMGGPGNGVPNENFMARWTGYFLAPVDGEYNFHTDTDDGIRLYIDEELIIDFWNGAGRNQYADIELDAGWHAMMMEFYERTVTAYAHLYWTPPDQEEEVLTGYTDFPWLDIEPRAAEIEGGDELEAVITVNAGGLEVGEVYEESLTLQPRDPDMDDIEIPVSLTVLEWQPGGIAIEPELFFIALDPGDDEDTLLTIENTGEGNLPFEINQIGEEVRWLEVNPTSGVIPVEESLDITLSFDTGDFEIGVYYQELSIHTNDPQSPEVRVPVTFSVGTAFGSVAGRVTDARTDEPVEGALVRLQGQAIFGLTDEDGNYTLDQVPAFRYHIQVTAEDYLPWLSDEIEVREDERTVVDPHLLHSEFVPEPDRIERQMPPDDHAEIPLTIHNPGNGPLTWSVERVFPGGGNIAPWEYRWEFAAGDSVDDGRMGGIEFVDDHFYIAGGCGGAMENVVYIFDREGNYIDQFPQFAESRYGMRDLAFDGQLLWGIDGNTVYGFTPQGDLVRQLDSPVRTARSIAWDAGRELLWIASVTTDIASIDRDGERGDVIDRPDGVHIYGMACFPEAPDGFNLYLFTSDGDYRQQVHKVNPATGESVFVRDLPDVEGARAGGLCISGLWDPYSWVFISMLDSPDAVGVWQLAPRTEWLRIAPVEGIVADGGEQELTVALDTRGLPEGEDFNADLVFTHNGVGGRTEVPVTLRTTGAGGVSQRVLRLVLGWNMVSLNVDPPEDSVEVIMRPLVDEDLLLLMKDGAGRFYNPQFNFNNIPGWNVAEGYQVKVERACEFEVEGEVVAWDTPIALERGWQIVAYYPRRSVDAVVALSGIEDHLILAKDNWGHFYNPEFHFSNMGDMSEGQGYQLKMDADDELVYVLGEEQASEREMHRKSQHFGAVSPTGRNMSLLVTADENFAGCELGAFSSRGLLAGSGVFGADGRCGIPVWGDDPATDAVDGLLEGEAFELRLWEPVRGVELRLPATRLLEGDGLYYQPDGFTALETSTERATPRDFYLSPNYPNPFNSSTRLTYALPVTARVTIEVYDLSGRLVTALVDGERKAGRHSVVWRTDDVAAGLYLMRMETTGFATVRKVVLVR